MELILASGNVHKKQEFSSILDGHSIVLPQEIGIDFQFEETGHSYLENSLGKAMSLYKRTGSPVFADDSGLSVPALNGAPGIYSARYGSNNDGQKLSDAERNTYLLNKMKDLEDRNAFFVCCIVLIIEEYRIFSAQETLSGVIAEAPSGVGGFGYDPVFFVPKLGKTVAELSDSEKNRISHRGRAAAKIQSILETL
ncbi:MAG: RdgB/HAM1 family non-canonical purine NTP pyrophosphatase [Spirochaetia bacterium]